jgi:hypothetical protein
MTYDAREGEVRRYLAHYFHTKPLASDTAEGICRWWFPTEVGVNENEVMAALSWLMQHGVVEELMAADGRVRYRRVRTDAAAAALNALVDAGAADE